MSKMTIRSTFSAGLAPLGRLCLGMTVAACLAAPIVAQQPDPPPPQQQGQQDGGRGGDMQERQLEHMTKALNLSPDQVTQIRAIHADTRQQMMALRNDASVQGPDKRSRMMSIHEAQEAKVKGVLNDDQRAKYDTMQARMREREQEHRQQPQGGDGQQPPPQS